MKNWKWLVAAVFSMSLAPAVTAQTALPTITLPTGFGPEDIALGRDSSFYVGSLSGQGIWRGNMRLGTGFTLVAGQEGQINVGVSVDRHNRLWVGGGFGGDTRVYDADTGAQLGAYSLAGIEEGSWISDMTVTEQEVFFTDSFKPQLFSIRLDRGGGLPVAPVVRRIPLTGDFVQQLGAFVFNANGIAWAGGRLIVGQTATGRLFNVDPRTGVAKAIDLGGELLFGADGLQLRGRTLYVAQNFANPPQVAVVELAEDLASGRVVKTLRDERFDTPSSVAVKGDRAFVVDARFRLGGPQYEIFVLPLGGDTAP